MTDTPAIRPLPRHVSLTGVAILALALLVGGTMLAPGPADAKRAKRQRVVSISPFATEVLAKVGVRPIRIGQVLSETDRTPAKFRGIRVLSLSHPYGVNPEVMLKLRPTLVLSSSRWKKGNQALRKLGIRVVEADPLRLSQAYRDVTAVGRAVKRRRAAARLRKAMKRQVKAATARPSVNVRTMAVLGVGKNPQFFLGNSWGGQLINVITGGRLLTGGVRNSSGFAPVLSDETVIKEDPDVIIVVPHGTNTDIGVAVESITGNPAWQTVSAVQNGRVKGSLDNRLLQAGTDIGRTMRIIRRCLTGNRAICE